METTPTPAKKSYWKFILISLLILAVLIISVIVVRKQRKKEMIKKIKASGSSITDNVLESMSYADLKTLLENSTATSST